MESKWVVPYKVRRNGTLRVRGFDTSDKALKFAKKHDLEYAYHMTKAGKHSPWRKTGVVANA